MGFGKKSATLKDLKKSLKKGSGSFVQYIPKEGSITVRFLTEPEEWLSYTEVFDVAANKGWPLPEGEEADADLRKSSRYVANVLDTEEDRVIPIQLPKTLANQLVTRYEKYDTIMDRDYELMRDGKGKETTYLATPESPTTRKTSKYTLIDLEKVLEDAYNHVHGDDDEDDEDEDNSPRRNVGKRRPSSKSPTRRRASHDDDDGDIDEEDDEDEAPVRKRKPAPAATRPRRRK